MRSTDEGFFSTKKIIKATLADSSKVECLNSNKGRRMNIEKASMIYFSTVIYHNLKGKGAVEWYVITVKNDMHARGVIDIYMEKGKKLQRIK
jgi:hypothetical protein